MLSEYEDFDGFVADCEGWLRAASVKILSNDSAREDVLQEGRITLWKTWRAYEGDSDRVKIALNRAKQRMMQVAWRDAPTTGNPAEKRRYEAKVDAHIDGMLPADVEELLAYASGVDDVEVAYHHGEIVAALNALTPKQRAYVYARFWCGMDASDGFHMVPGVREARNNNPILRRDVLWTGNKTSVGAKKVLAAKLAHLHDLVRA